MTLEQPDFNSFDTTVSALFSRVRGHIEPGAHRLFRLLPTPLVSALYQIPTILVAGTNGKGTTCALLEQCFRDSGYHTALYTSPHIVSPTERIRINGVVVTDERFLKSAQNAFDHAKKALPDATFFELMTALAFEIISEAKPDVFICEVGLGGRLDSTNILNPLVSVLTSVGLDHTEWLGDNLEKIAFEKTFVSRRNRAFVIGPVDSASTDGIQAALRVTGAQPCWIQHHLQSSAILEETITEILKQFALAGGPHVTPASVPLARHRFFWPGRFDLRQIANTPVVFDAAHNPHGVEYFLNQCNQSDVLNQLPKPWILVFASLADKNWQNSLEKLLPNFEEIHLTQTASSRAVKPEALLQFAASEVSARGLCSHLASSDALSIGLSRATQKRGTLFILGSITLLGEAMEFFSIPVFPENTQSKK